MKTCPKSGKRCYDSEKHARRACKTAGNRTASIACPDCHALHVTGSAAER